MYMDMQHHNATCTCAIPIKTITRAILDTCGTGSLVTTTVTLLPACCGTIEYISPTPKNPKKTSRHDLIPKFGRRSMSTPPLKRMATNVIRKMKVRVRKKK